MNSLIPGADILEDFHFIPDSKSTTLVYKFGSSTEHSPYDEGLTTMGAGTAIYYFTATGTLGTIYAFAAGDQKAFLKKYNNGTWSNWVALVSNADFVDLTLNSGIVNASNNSGGRNKLGYCKIGDIVYIAGGIGITNFSGNTTAVAQLPSGYRPATIHYYFAPLSGSRICRALVNPNGSIYVEWAKNINDGSNVTGELIWIDLSTWFVAI